MHGLEAKYSDQVNFVYLDIDDSRNDAFKQALGYVYQPHIFLLDENGEIITQWVGFVGAEALESAIVDAVSQ